MQKFVPALEGNLSLKNAPKLSSKYFPDKTCKIKQMKNIPVILMTFLNFLGKRNTKQDSSNTTTSKVLSKISNRKKAPKQQYNFCMAKISLEVHGVQWRAKFLREKNLRQQDGLFQTKISV